MYALYLLFATLLARSTAQVLSLKDIATAELAIVKKHCFSPLTDLPTCYDSIDASMLTNKPLLKGMALAKVTFKEPLEEALVKAKGLSQAGRSAFFVYYLYLKRSLKSVLLGPGGGVGIGTGGSKKVKAALVDENSKLRELNVYSYLTNWSGEEEMLRNGGRMQLLASLLVKDPKSSYSFMLERQSEFGKQKGRSWYPNFLQKEICKYLRASPNSKWLSKSDWEVDTKLATALEVVQSSCSEDEGGSNFMVDLLNGTFKSAKEILEHVKKEATDPILLLSFIKVIDPKVSASSFPRLQKLDNLITSIVQIKCKSGPDYETLKRPNFWSPRRPSYKETV